MEARGSVSHRPWKDDRALPCDPVPAAELQWALECHAPSPQLEVARGLLERTGAVVLVAKPGSGGRSAALHLLAALAAAGRLTVHALEPDAVHASHVEQLLAEDGHAHLLELDEVDTGAGWIRFCREVIGRAGVLRARGGYLVVRAAPARWCVGPEAAGLPVVALGRPDPREVALRHLRCRDRSDRISWLDVPVVARELAAAGPAAAARLAALVADAADAEAAAQEFAGWPDHLRGWFEGGPGALGHADLAERALIVSAAILNRRRRSQVWAASNRLLEAVGPAEERLSPLAGPGLRSRVEAVQARMEGASVRVDWKLRALDQAVLDYVWDEYPELRQPLLRWMVALPGHVPDAGEDGWRQVADALRGLVVRQEDTTFLDVVAAAGQSAHCRLVAEVLSAAGRDAQVGRAVRRRLYQWASSQTVQPSARMAAADACARELGRERPRCALTRLRHLARSPEEAVLAAVAAAVVRLALVPELRRQVILEVAGWRSAPDARLRRSGGAAFLALASAHVASGDLLLLADGCPPPVVARQAAVAGWRHVLGTPGDCAPAQLNAAVAVWLEAAASGASGTAAGPVGCAEPLEVLHDATRGDRLAVSALGRAVRAWTAASADAAERRMRSAVAARVAA